MALKYLIVIYTGYSDTDYKLRYLPDMFHKV